MKTPTTPIETATRLERETCGRCGGSGRYSWCQAHGDKCFQCAGSGVVLTKRGKAAAAHLTSLRSRAASDVKPGDVIRGTGLTVGGNLYGTWQTVVEVLPYENEIRSFIDGIEQPRRADLLTVRTTDREGPCSHLAVAPETMFQVRQSAEQQAATLAMALEYQTTLTKAGKPRKAIAASRATPMIAK